MSKLKQVTQELSSRCPQYENLQDRALVEMVIEGFKDIDARLARLEAGQAKLAGETNKLAIDTGVLAKRMQAQPKALIRR